jgi:prolipoprotein diacylglyceryltransferase
MDQGTALTGGWRDLAGRLVQPWTARTLRLGRRTVSAFRFWGGTGILAALLVSVVCAWILSLSVAVILLLAAVSVGTSLVLVLLRTVLTGSEVLVFLHHAVAAGGASVVTLHLVDEPLLPYLEIVVLGLGVVLAFGRLGCLSAGCCHGRPHDWGVIYTADHARIGFSESLVGVRLFPLQLAAALCVAAITVAGYAWLILGGEAGSSLAWCVASYCWARLGFEFLRGDPVRPYGLGFSEAQWTCILVNVGILASGRAGWLPAGTAMQTAGIAFLAVAALSRLYRLGRPTLTAREIVRVAEAVHSRSPAGPGYPGPRVRSTDTGLCVSASLLTDGSRKFFHYALSSRGGQPGDSLVAAFARLVMRLDGVPIGTPVVRQDGGRVVHCLIRAPERMGS